MPPVPIKDTALMLAKATAMAITPRYALYLDERGILHCDKIIHEWLSFATIKSSKKGPRIVRRVLPVEHCNLLSSLTKMVNEGYSLEEEMVFIRGTSRHVPFVEQQIEADAVQALAQITNMDKGGRLHDICRATDPEIIDRGVWMDLDDGPVQPFTDVALDAIAGYSSDWKYYLNAYISDMDNEEIDWLLDMVDNSDLA